MRRTRRFPSEQKAGACVPRRVGPLDRLLFPRRQEQTPAASSTRTPPESRGRRVIAPIKRNHPSAKWAASIKTNSANGIETCVLARVSAAPGCRDHSAICGFAAPSFECYNPTHHGHSRRRLRPPKNRRIKVVSIAFIETVETTHWAMATLTMD